MESALNRRLMNAINFHDKLTQSNPLPNYTLMAMLKVTPISNI